MNTRQGFRPSSARESAVPSAPFWIVFGLGSTNRPITLLFLSGSALVELAAGETLTVTVEFDTGAVTTRTIAESPTANYVHIERVR